MPRRPYDAETVPAGTTLVFYRMGEVVNEINGQTEQVRLRVGTAVAQDGTVSAEINQFASFWVEPEQPLDTPSADVVGGADASGAAQPTQ